MMLVQSLPGVFEDRYVLDGGRDRVRVLKISLEGFLENFIKIQH